MDGSGIVQYNTNIVEWEQEWRRCAGAAAPPQAAAVWSSIASSRARATASRQHLPHSFGITTLKTQNMVDVDYHLF